MFRDRLTPCFLPEIYGLVNGNVITYLYYSTSQHHNGYSYYESHNIGKMLALRFHIYRGQVAA